MFFRYNRKNVTPEKVTNSYEACEELFLSVGRAYIVCAAMSLLGMNDVDDVPSQNKFTGNPEKATKEEKQMYFDNIIGKFVDKYIIQNARYVDVSQGEDYVTNYATYYIFLTTLLLQIKDAAKEADGERNLIHQKLLLNIFKTKESSQSNYAKEMFVAVSQVEALLTPQLAEEFKWGYYVNWKGGKGNNIEDDLCQEICNGIGKKVVRRMGGNKNISAISKVCSAVSGIKDVTDNYDSNTGKKKPSSRHAKQDAIKEEKEMVKDLLKLKPFTHTQNRSHKSFKDIKRHPLKELDQLKFSTWLSKCRSDFPANTE